LHMGRVRFTALQTGRGPTLSVRVIDLTSRGQSATADTRLHYIWKTTHECRAEMLNNKRRSNGRTNI